MPRTDSAIVVTFTVAISRTIVIGILVTSVTPIHAAVAAVLPLTSCVSPVVVIFPSNARRWDFLKSHSHTANF